MDNVIRVDFREWETDEPANDILASMAGMPIPRLGNVHMIDCTAKDLLADLKELTERHAREQLDLMARFIDYAEKHS